MRSPLTHLHFLRRRKRGDPTQRHQGTKVRGERDVWEKLKFGKEKEIQSIGQFPDFSVSYPYSYSYSYSNLALQPV